MSPIPLSDTARSSEAAPKPMRNSIIPIVCVLLVCVALVPMSLRGPDRGSGGPEVEPLLFRAPVKRVHQVESMPLTATNAVSVVAPSDAPAAFALDLRSFVVVSGDDRSPLTAAVMLALAELITAYQGRDEDSYSIAETIAGKTIEGSSRPEPPAEGSFDQGPQSSAKCGHAVWQRRAP